MSRGPGRVQRELLSAARGELVVAVPGIVRAMTPVPTHDDFASARRATRQLVLAERLSAVPMWTCSRCYRPLDFPDRPPCCGAVRAMVCVCEPHKRRLLHHPAPFPGGPAPAYLNVAPAPGLLDAFEPTLGDLADLVTRRCFDALLTGKSSAASVQAVVALLRLRRQFQHDDAVAALAGAQAEADVAKRAMTTLMWGAKKHMDDATWRAFAKEYRRECEPFAGSDPSRQR